MYLAFKCYVEFILFFYWAKRLVWVVKNWTVERSTAVGPRQCRNCAFLVSSPLNSLSFFACCHIQLFLNDEYKFIAQIICLLQIDHYILLLVFIQPVFVFEIQCSIIKFFVATF